jgi:hypothetical protein
MLVSEIFARFRRQIGDDGTVQFTDADLLRWINDACREIAQDNDILQVKATSPTTSGTAEYLLPSNILKLHSVRWKGNKLSALGINEWDDFISQSTVDASVPGDPTHVLQWANSITLFPKPVTSSSDLTLLYSRQPVPVTLSTQEPDVPDTYHLSIVRYCLAQAAEMDDDAELYRAKMNEFTDDVMKKRSDRDIEDDVYPSISVAARDTSWGDVW